MRPEYFVTFFIALGVSLIVNLIIACIRSLDRGPRNHRETQDSRTRTTEIPQRNAGAMPRTTASPPALPGLRGQNRSVRTVSRGRNGTPALPNRPRTTRRNPLDFPRCPIHRCCNRRGEPQKIFWDESNHSWRCYQGHSFFS